MDGTILTNQDQKAQVEAYYKFIGYPESVHADSKFIVLLEPAWCHEKALESVGCQEDPIPCQQRKKRQAKEDR